MVSPVAASAFDVRHLGVTDSTNDWLLTAARDGAAHRTVAVADFQRKGRGRLDRRWEAPVGSALLCSVLLRVRLDPEDRHLCATAVGLAALDACAATAQLAARLKWPNDLVVEDRKLGGILAETDGQPDADGATPIVVGIGVNLSWPGPPGSDGTSLLASSGRRVERDALLASMLDALAARDVELSDAEGRARLVSAYRAHLATLGRRVRVELRDGDVVGIAEDVDASGRLVVTSTSGTRVFSTGDVVHLRALDRGAAEGRE